MSLPLPRGGQHVHARGSHRQRRRCAPQRPLHPQRPAGSSHSYKRKASGASAVQAAGQGLLDGEEDGDDEEVEGHTEDVHDHRPVAARAKRGEGVERHERQWQPVSCQVTCRGCIWTAASQWRGNKTPHTPQRQKTRPPGEGKKKSRQ